MLDTNIFTQNYWGFRICPSSSTLKTRKHNVSKLNLFPFSGDRRESPTLLGVLEGAGQSMWHATAVLYAKSKGDNRKICSKNSDGANIDVVLWHKWRWKLVPRRFYCIFLLSSLRLSLVSGVCIRILNKIWVVQWLRSALSNGPSRGDSFPSPEDETDPVLKRCFIVLRTIWWTKSR
jgi:hypothetical protein